MFLENILGSRTKVKLLRVLSEARTAYSLKSLKKETALSLGITHKAAEELAEENIVIKIKGTGKERLYKFNSHGEFAGPIFDLFRTEKTRQRREVIFLHTWSVLENFVSKNRGKVDLILLFGSVARGDATLQSDIDVLVIPRSNKDFIEKINKINPTILNLAAFKEEIAHNTLFYRNLKKDALILYIRPKLKKELSSFREDLQSEET
ncbi:nucleotidyltransferase domain-containing protein [Candidatus Woesearchaeota archaeon]|nr:nucleotidyltransferase domain-containing protein [Candidatus Woesearchaeota archaeon]